MRYYILLLNVLAITTVYAATSDTSFTTEITVVENTPPFDINATGMQFGTVEALVDNSCIATLSFNGTIQGFVNGSCPSYSGLSEVGIIQLNGTNPDTDPPTVVSVDNVSGYDLENGPVLITGTAPLAAGDLTGNSFTNCTVRQDFPTCTIYFANTSIEVPLGAAGGAYSTTTSPVEVVLTYN